MSNISSSSNSLLGALMQSHLSMTASALRLATGVNASSPGYGMAARLSQESSVSSVGARNGHLGLARLQTESSSLDQAQSIVGRIDELRVRALDGTLTDADRGAIDAEAQQLMTELQEMEANTSFNGQKILQGDTLSTHIDGALDFEDANLGTVTGALAGLDLSTAAGANAAGALLENAQTALNEERVKVGAQEVKLSRSVDSAMNKAVNLSEAASHISSVDIAAEMATFIGSQLQNSLAVKTLSSVHRFESDKVKGLLGA